MEQFKSLSNGLKLLAFMVLTVASFCFAMFQGGFVSWFLFAAFLPIALYSISLYFYPIENIAVERNLQKSEYRAGDTVPVHLKIVLPVRFPLFYVFIHDTVMRKRKNQIERTWRTLQFPLLKKTLEYEYEIPKISRGEFQFTEIRVTVADLFGFIRKEVELQEAKPFIVYPVTVPLQYLPQENEFDQGLARTKDMVQRDTTMAISVREYQQGDRFSWINWKASARKNQLMTKEFEQRKNQDVFLVLDRTPCKQFELLVTFCASVVTAVLKEGIEIGFYSFGKEREYIRLQQGQSHLQKIFLALARVEDDAEIELAQIIRSEELLKRHLQHIVFIVHSLNQELVSELMHLARDRSQISVFVVKPRQELISREEISLLASLKQKGIQGRIIREGEFAHAFARGEVG